MRPFDPALLRALPATRGPVALLSLVGVVSGAVAIAQAVALAWAVHRVVTGGDLTGPLTWLVLLLAARGVLAGLTEHVARVAGLRVAAVLRLAVLRRWLRRPEETRPPAEVGVTRATEGVSAVEPYVARYLPALVTGAVVPVLAVLTLAVIDVWSALIVVLTVPLLPLFAALIGQHTQDQTERRWEAMALLAGHFLDVVRGLPTLVGYGRAWAQVDVVREVGDRHRRATVQTLRTAFLTTAALELLATISVALVAVAVGLRLAFGQLDLLTGFAAILLAPEAYWPIRRVGAEFHNAADGAETLEKLRAEGVLDEQGEEGTTGAGPAAAAATRSGPDGVAADRTALRPDQVGLAGVSYAHPGRRRSIVDVSLTSLADPGLTALTGPSGAGKTTVLELLAGLRTPDAGQVVAPRAHLAAQRPVILPGTVRDNLALVDEGLTGPQMVAALDRVGLWDALAGREGLDTVLGDDGFGLSAGQRSRLALARAALSGAPLVLLDEPTANVAITSLPALHTVITALARTRRVVVVTHDPDLAALADDRWRVEPAPAPARHRPPAPLHARVPTTGAGVTTAHRDRAGGMGNAREKDDSDGTAGPGDGAHPEPGVVAPIETPRGRHGLVLACLIGGASVACGVALTATSGWLIVQASTQPVILTLLVAIVGVRAFGIFRPVFRYAERVVSHDVALEELADRRADVFARLIPLTPARLGRRSRGEVLTTVVRDLDDVVDERVRVTVPAWSAVLATVVGVVLAGWHVPAAGLALAAGALLVLAVSAAGYVLEHSAQGQAVRSRGQVQHLTTALTSRLLAVQAVTGVDADPRPLVRPVAEAEEAQQALETRLIRARALTILGLWLVVAATTAVVAQLTWSAHTAGLLSAPYAAMVALIPLALADPWTDSADIAGARARARAAAARLARVLDQGPAVATGGAQDEDQTGRAPITHLALNRAGASWTASPARAGAGGEGPPHTSLDLPPLDLDLPPGTRVALTGPNGTGKSTALALLARHLDPATGSCTADGQDVRDLPLGQVRGAIAVVDDEPHAFLGSVRANLVLAAPEASDDELLAALDAVDLGHWYDTLSDGLDTRLSGLSGGERARLSLARALVSARPVVLLDEPTAHLDDATAERALAGLLASRPADDGVVVMVSHRPGSGAGWVTEQVHLGKARSAQVARIG
ncbi:thiol reductant ABC exporter subunit CydC [Serinicoccus sp. CUA-874]|uniref:thiol reductant ABC exporter subunit CydC n=1 Tax=Serinicoccus sp. CUA-874 TaxID=1517939 RepID=UPI000959382D|nr:thiol reductant ABC exporter subunit CydC [Serinicoccus sp. CUA-874]OLT18027.1 thiol reductant ABC exporter subunit CydC [Serinicoccus sp. CUA-874]